MKSRQKRRLFFLIGLPGLILLAIGLVVVQNNLKDATVGDQRVSQDYLHRTITDFQSMGERSSWEKQAAACLYLEYHLKALGVASEIQTYFHEQKEWRNIVAIFPGNSEHATELLAVAHYDSISRNPRSKSPGADDNASGVAVLLEMARLLRTIPHQSSIRLVFFSNEEQGELGSKSFARWARESGKNIRGVINIDVVGYDAPWALFSREPFSILNADLSPVRKFYMLAKMAKNLVCALVAGQRSLKLMARSQDSSLLPIDVKDQTAIGLGRVRWDMGSTCT